MIIGRELEQKKLLKAAASEYSEFVAVYGRRRVGKTFLIRETFKYKFTFYHTGLSQKSTREQLREFQKSLKTQGLEKANLPTNWFDAFDQLERLLDQSGHKKKLVFIDEMPWMDAPRSSFVSALEHFWNGWASARKDIVLIICGSATSWIINKVIKNHGGLHNRITYRIHLHAFNLHECEQYAKALRLGMNRRQILEAYMIMGGIPFYWSKLDREYSLVQNVNSLFFNVDGDLRHEFDDLYASLFSKPEQYVTVVTALATKKAGMTRKELVAGCGIIDNGQLTTVLENLEYCGFIRKFNSINTKKKNALFQLIDNYTLFYFKFIAQNSVNDNQYWTKVIKKPEYNAWCGLAFERACLLHVEQIKKKLGISGVLTSVSSWVVRGTKERKGAQIDLLIDRDDDVINLCEMKYTKAPYAITSDYDEVLQNKLNRFIEETKTTKAVRLTMVTSNRLVRNSYSDEILNQVVMEDLFDKD